MFRFLSLGLAYTALFAIPSFIWIWAISVSWPYAVLAAGVLGLVHSAVQSYHLDVARQSDSLDEVLQAHGSSYSVSRGIVVILLFGSVSGAIVGGILHIL